MLVCVINLDRSPERFAHMQRQFKQLGISFIRITAVDAREITNEEIDAFRLSVADSRRAHPWSPAEIGIFLSHKKAWSRIVSESDGYAAVFEDDVHLSSRIMSLLKNAEWIPRSADIVRFETTGQGMKLARTPTFQVEDMKGFRVYSGAWGAAGYVIKREIAEWLACSPQHIYEPVDWLLFHPKSAL